MLKKAPKTKLAFFVAVAMALIATACNHGSVSTTPETTTTQATRSGPVVVAPPSTTTTQVAPKPITTILKEPTEPQARPTTKYFLIAKLRQTSEKRTIPVYSSPNGDLIIKEKYTDPHSGQERVRNNCDILIDFGSDCFPTDPTYWGARATFLVTNKDAKVGDQWAEVLLSTRPNGQTGWIETSNFEWKTHRHHIIVDLSDKTISVWEGEAPVDGSPDERKLLHHAQSIVGRPDRPTPEVASTFVTAKIFNNNKSRSQGGQGAAYGSWIFTIALFSDTLTEFGGGTPQVAIHGTNEPEKIGDTEFRGSSGCVRLHNNVIDNLAAIIEVGTPVSIIT